MDGRRRRNAGISVSPGRVRQARIEAGLSLADVAGDDVSRTFIHFIEHGRSRPSQSVLELIAKRTGKPISYFTAEESQSAESIRQLANDLVDLADRVRKLVAGRRITPAEREGLRLLEVLLRQGASLCRVVEVPAKRSGAGRRRLPRQVKK